MSTTILTPVKAAHTAAKAFREADDEIAANRHLDDAVAALVRLSPDDFADPTPVVAAVVAMGVPTGTRIATWLAHHARAERLCDAIEIRGHWSRIARELNTPI